MEEKTKVSRFADFDRADPGKSYLIDCLMIARSDQQGVMFDAGNIAPGEICARLEGYAIIPRETYEALMNGATRDFPSP